LGGLVGGIVTTHIKQSEFNSIKFNKIRFVLDSFKKVNNLKQKKMTITLFVILLNNMYNLLI